jgi:hypothetical protein
MARGGHIVKYDAEAETKIDDQEDAEFRRAMKLMRSGELPWDLDGYDEAMTYIEELLKTPKDDWPTKPMNPIHLRENDGSTSVIRINPHHPINQIMKYLESKYDYPTATSHWARFMNMNSFFARHRERLLREDLIHVEDGGVAIHPDLLDALMTQRYGKRHAFVLKDVLRAVRAAQEKAAR